MQKMTREATLKLDIRNNFLHLWQRLAGQQGWDILIEDDLVCLKSPANIPNLNISYGINSSYHLDKAAKFFKGKKFAYIKEDIEEKSIFDFKKEVTVNITEMFISNYQKKNKNSFVITSITSEDDLAIWAEIASPVFGMEREEIKKYNDVVSKLDNAWFFLAYDENIPVGTGHIYIDDQDLAYISTIGVLEANRRKGIGTAIMEECIDFSFKNGAKYVGLHASEMGINLYKNMGFEQIKVSEFSIIDTLIK
jgi:ribosomal protein S18 acetylase RimI-like enzyme